MWARSSYQQTRSTGTVFRGTRKKTNSPSGCPYGRGLLSAEETPLRIWCLRFVSFDQKRKRLQARSIGGFLISEQIEWPTFTEILRGTRECSFPGGQIMECRPIDPSLTVELQRLMDHPQPGWKFYRMSTEANRDNLAEGWFEGFAATIPDELKATRLTGGLGSFEGQIFPTFSEKVHVVDDEESERFLRRPGLVFTMGTDWGASALHAQSTTFGAQDGAGDWHVFGECWSNDATRLVSHHAADVLAMSIAYGWPVPQQVNRPTTQTAWVADLALKQLGYQGTTPEARTQFLASLRSRHRNDCTHGMNWCDHRPDCIREYASYGIPSSEARKSDWYAATNVVRGLLHVSPYTNRPKLTIHRRCKHLIDELPRHRWDPRQLANPGPIRDNEDTVCAMRYMVTSAPPPAGPTKPGWSSVHVSLKAPMCPFNAPTAKEDRP